MDFFEVNLTAALLIFSILLFRFFTVGRLPKKVFLFLWALVFLRLLFPFFVEFPTGKTVPGFADAARRISRAGYAAVPGVSAVAAGTGRSWPVLSVLWLAGSAVCLLLLLFLFLRIRARLSDAIPIRGNERIDRWRTSQKLHRTLRVMHSDRIVSPLCCGVLHPRIILPSGLDLSDTEKLEFVLAHEMVHVRRMDAVWKTLLALLCCVYWLNPAVWVFAYFFHQDLELSCDEQVLRRMQPDAREAYANALVELAASANGLDPVVQQFSGHAALKERLVSIVRCRREAPAWAPCWRCFWWRARRPLSRRRPPARISGCRKYRT